MGSPPKKAPPPPAPDAEIAEPRRQRYIAQIAQSNRLSAISHGNQRSSDGLDVGTALVVGAVIAGAMSIGSDASDCSTSDSGSSFSDSSSCGGE